MIQSFADKATETYFTTNRIAKGTGWQKVASVVGRKLASIEAAVELEDLSSPPGNKLEALDRDREGQHSIRVNDQWRVCFVWTDAGPANVEVVDYH